MRRPAKHRQVGDLEVLGDDERRGPQRRRGQQGPDAGGGQHAAGPFGRVPGLAHDRPGDRAGADGGGRPPARHRAEQKSQATVVRPAALRERRNAATERSTKNLARAGEFEHRTVDREQHDVRRGDVERSPEEAAARVVQCIDDLIEIESGMRDRPILGEQPAVIAVGQKQERTRREGPNPLVRRHASRISTSNSAPIATSIGLEQALTVQERVVAAAARPDPHRQHRIQADHQGDCGQHPVQCARPIVGLEAGPVRTGRPGTPAAASRRERRSGSTGCPAGSGRNTCQIARTATANATMATKRSTQPPKISPRPFLIVDLGHRGSGRGGWRRRSGRQRRGARLGRRCPPHRIGRYAGARRYAADCELSESLTAP